MKVTAILKGRKDRDEKQPIQIRINEGAKRRYIATKMRVLSSQFKGGKVINHPLASQYNQKIKALIIETEGRQLSGDKHHYPAIDFFAYCKECDHHWDKDRAAETLRQHRSEQNKVAAFAPALSLSDINLKWLNNYKAYLYSIGNTPNTVWKSFKFLRLIVSKATKEKKIPENPFAVFEMPRYRDPKKVFLLKEQVQVVEEFARETESEELKLAATWFVIGCYTGLRFGDMQAFDKKKHIVKDRLIMYTSKTGEVVSLPISAHLKALFEHVHYKGMHYHNVHFNRLLKTIAALCAIDMKVSVHTARHTAAMMLANAGVSIEVTAKILGQTNLKTTAIYYKISNQRIDEEMKKLNL